MPTGPDPRTGPIHREERTAVSDPQDVAEAFDRDKLDEADDYGDEELEDYPPDRPSGVGPMAMTPAEEAFPEPEGLRTWREEPDPLAVELDRRADELDDEVRDHAAARRDGTGDELATEDERLARDPELGGLGLEGDAEVERLTATSPLVGDDEATLVAEEVDAPDGESAEEEAMHLAADPPLRADDSYLDDDR
jgi:hypothetical protein